MKARIADAVYALDEALRHASEVRYVAALPGHAARSEYLQGVAGVRGAASAERLRNDAWKLIKAGPAR
jgi:uncharacterized alpha-E superfamily protein